MRFNDIKIGERFFLEGLEYTKTSPVLASDAKGRSRIIPRSADLQPHPTQAEHPSHIEDSELDRFYHAIKTILRQEVHDSDLEVRLRHAVEMAWKSIKGNVE